MSRFTTKKSTNTHTVVALLPRHNYGRVPRVSHRATMHRPKAHPCITGSLKALDFSHVSPHKLILWHHKGIRQRLKRATAPTKLGFATVPETSPRPVCFTASPNVVTRNAPDDIAEASCRCPQKLRRPGVKTPLRPLLPPAFCTGVNTTDRSDHGVRRHNVPAAVAMHVATLGTLSTHR